LIPFPYHKHGSSKAAAMSRISPLLICSRTIVDTRWLTTQPEEHGDTNRQPMREDGLGTGMGWAACRLGSKDGRRGVMWREGCIQARCLR
jgi:hypothetical protein